MTKQFEKMYKDLVMTNYFIFKYNARFAGSGFDILDEELLSGIDIPN